MRSLILILLAAATAWGQTTCGQLVINPVTHRPDCVGLTLAAANSGSLTMVGDITAGGAIIAGNGGVNPGSLQMYDAARQYSTLFQQISSGSGVTITGVPPVTVPTGNGTDAPAWLVTTPAAGGATNDATLGSGGGGGHGANMQFNCSGQGGNAPTGSLPGNGGDCVFNAAGPGTYNGAAGNPGRFLIEQNGSPGFLIGNTGIVELLQLGTASGTYTPNNLGCAQSAATIGDCTAGQLVAGVNISATGAFTAQLAQVGSVYVNSFAQSIFTFGHAACSDATHPANILDNSGTGSCPPGTTYIGSVGKTDLAVTFLHLINLNITPPVMAPSLDAVQNPVGNALFTFPSGGTFTLNVGSQASGGLISLQQGGVAVVQAGASGNFTANPGLNTGSATVHGGIDQPSGAVSLGAGLVRGGDITSGATTGSTAGSGVLRGGDNASTATSGTITGGNATVRPGEVTAGGGATQTNGQLFVFQPFVKGGTFTAANNSYLSAAPASGAGPGDATASDCTAALGNCQQFIGPNSSAVGNSGPVQTHGIATVSSTSAAQWAASDYVCVDPVNAAKFISSGAVGCYGTRQAGIAVGDSASVSSHPMLVQPGNPLVSRKILTAPQSSIGALADVTGLSFAVAASTNYTITCELVYQTTASTASLAIAFSGPSSPTALRYSLSAASTTSATVAATFQAESASSFATQIGDTLATTATTDMPATVTLGLVNGVNAGTVQLRAAGIGTGTVTIQAGSFCMMQ